MSKVHFVGAGPGDVELITLKGYKQLSQADVVIYAGSLVDPALLEYCKEGAEIYDSAGMHLLEIIDVMEAGVKAGKEVVRLQTGDFSIYGSIREQIEEMKKRGIAFDCTPGVSSFLGAGSTDASIINKKGDIQAVHLAGAGDMVTMLINTELGLEDRHLAEDIKKYPLAKVESIFHIRHEDGSVQFFDKPLSGDLFARVVIVKDTGELIPLDTDYSIEKIKIVRQTAKERVFVTNAIRALKTVSPTQDIRDIPFVVIVGGSALDFEIPQLITDALSQSNIVAGRGNIRGTAGPRNAVATGLVLSYCKEKWGDAYVLSNN
ncbi:TPA: diol dehydratase reactivase ATPase-like domain-containing protein [Streptococcus suis]